MNPFDVNTVLEQARAELAAAAAAVDAHHDTVEKTKAQQAAGTYQHDARHLSWAENQNRGSAGNVADKKFWRMSDQTLPLTAPGALPTIVTPEWLKTRMQEVGMVQDGVTCEVHPAGFHIVDCSWGESEDMAAEHETERISGAKFLDLNQFRESVEGELQLPFKIPSSNTFSQAVEALGICNGDTVVVYDRTGVYTAAYAWWLFRLFGHIQVAVLTGGLEGFQEKEGAVVGADSQRPEKIPEVDFLAVLTDEMVRSTEDLQANATGEHQKFQLIDACSAGPIPFAKSVDFTALSLGQGVAGPLHPPEQLKAVFDLKQLDLTPRGQPFVLYDNLGPPAAVLALALEVAGVSAHKISIYGATFSAWADSKAALSIER